jgi:hypothetical protein
MGVVNTTYTFSGTDTITSAKLNNIIDDTTFTSDAIQGTTLQVVSPGKLAVNAGGITSNELAAGAVSNINVSNTAAIAGTKISPDFGAQNITTTGNASIGQLTAKFSKFGNYTGEFQGITLQNNNDSAVSTTVSFIDTQNNLGTPDTSIFSRRYTNGAADIDFSVTPAGSRSADRRVSAVTIQSTSNMVVQSVSCDNLNNRTKFFIKGFNNANTDDAIIFVPSIATDADNANACTFFSPNGLTVRGSIRIDSNSTIYGTGSDHRLKNDAKSMVGSLDRLSQLKPVNFEWVSNGKRSDGFLAHELQEIVPDCVSGKKDAVDENGNPILQVVDHSKLVPLLVAAIQELKKKVDKLESK